MKLKKQLIIIAIIVLAVPVILILPIYGAITDYSTATDDVTTSSRLAHNIFSRRLLAGDYINSQSERAKAQWYTVQKDLISTVEGNAITPHSTEEKTLLDKLKQELARSESIFNQLVEARSGQDEASDSNRVTFLTNQLTVTAQETIQTATSLADLNKNQARLAFGTIITLLVGAATFFFATLVFCFFFLWKSAGSLEKIDRMKSEFISLASHQLKTPLTSMRWYSELLLNQFAGSLKKEQKEYIGTIYTSAIHMNELVNTLLNISRIESGRLMVRPKKTDVTMLVKSVVADVKPKADEKHQEIAVSISNNIPEFMVDEGLLRQIYLNLLTNAIKYSPEKTAIKVAVKIEGKELLSTVTDSGYGIPKKDYDRVFQKFYRGENILKKGTEGTGLGLYLIKMIIESFGGTIWFESTIGKGTSFSFTVPTTGMKAKKGEVGLS